MSNDLERYNVEITMTPEDAKFTERCGVAGLPLVVISMYKSALKRLVSDEREWVGLTDEEIDGIYKTHHDQYGKCQTGGFEYERTIEAKLKEKNT